MKTEIIQYEPIHAFELFERQVREFDFILSSLGDWERAANAWKEAGPSFTLTIDGVAEACGGIVLIDETLGECWLLIPKTNHGIIVYRSIVKKFQELIVQYKFRRLQAFIMENFTSGCKLIERLGFIEEGRPRNYGPNKETFILYGRIF